jgi:CRISPR system Cascade subunit CasC
MQLEIHILQSFPPANLNRDENGMPKSTVFGGRPRARISSQCQKWATRKFYQENAELSAEQFAHRSRAWLQELKALLTQQDIPENKADVAAKLALTEGLKVKLDEKTGESKTILFLGKTELATIADILTKNWDKIEPEIAKENPTLPTKDPNISKGIEKALIDSGKPGDVALFGRMMASLPTVNVDAAVQVAHAISVNTLQQEFDFFTAVDDLNASEDQGADHMGETGYNSSTYYRYANLDTVQLAKNLGSEEQVPAIAKAFAEAFIKAIPTGHQNSFAAHSLPAAVMIVVRKGQPVSLVDAFEDPIRPSNGLSLLENSIKALDEHWADMVKMYGDSSVEFKGVVTRIKFEELLKNLNENKLDSLDELLNKTIEAAFAKGGEE